jgi:hypothetical protein
MLEGIMDNVVEVYSIADGARRLEEAIHDLIELRPSVLPFRNLRLEGAEVLAKLDLCYRQRCHGSFLNPSASNPPDAHGDVPGVVYGCQTPRVGEVGDLVGDVAQGFELRLQH